MDTVVLYKKYIICLCNTSKSLGEEICLARAAAPVIVISGIQIDGSRHSPIVCRRGRSSLCSYWSIE
jgi:hypothetical protein